MSAIQDLIEKIRTYIRKKPWKKLKKADYFVLICIGVLLMVIAMPETVPDGKLSFKESKPALLSATETQKTYLKQKKTMTIPRSWSIN